MEFKKFMEAKIQPLPPHLGVGFTSDQPVSNVGHSYEQTGRYHNYKVNPKSFRWPSSSQDVGDKVIDGFSPNVNKDLHVGHLRNLAVARALKGLHPNSKFVSMLGYSMGEKPGAAQNLQKWFDFVGYQPQIHKDIDLKGPEEEMVPGEGEFEGSMVWHGPKGPVLMKRSANHPERPGEHTYGYHDLALARNVGPTHVVTGAEQKGHFEELGMGDKHLPMGLVLDAKTGQKMKSRDGTAMSAQEALIQIIDKLGATKYPKELAWNILAWNFLRLGREKNVKFDPDDWSKPDSPGLYITYTVARVERALKKAGYDGHIDINKTELSDKDAELAGFAEYFNHYLDIARNTMDPAPVANYALELAKKISKVYKEEKFIGGRDGLIAAVQHANNALKKAMQVIGMFILDEV
jgi:arginyl-tRNA synthetase